MKKFVATALLLTATPAIAATYVAPPVHVAPIVHVAPVVRVNPMVRPTTTIVRPVVHPHHLRPQPVVVYTAPQSRKCVEQKPGSKECAKK